ncbi:MAG: molybdenum cofactor guanylyltransferase [bacterium]|nr:MAG: molybdenum cofactor guanylyltransferase [bacterium]
MTPADASLEGITGAILIGGRSRRLGQDKVLLPFMGKPLLVHLHSLLASLFGEVLGVGHARPGLEALGLVVTEDLIPGAGALGGIYTALERSPDPLVFVLAADMPFVSAAIIRKIAHHPRPADAVIPRGPRGVEPLCALYSRSCREAIKRSLDQGSLRIMEALRGLHVVTPPITPAPGGRDPFSNINYPEDLAILSS